MKFERRVFRGERELFCGITLQWIATYVNRFNAVKNILCSDRLR